MMEIPRIHTSNLFDQVYGTLKQLILGRAFRPNEKLSIPVLAKDLGISITPIREALNRLEAEGLVKTVAKVGTFVVGIDRTYVEQAMEIRLMIDYWMLDKYRRLDEAQYAAAVGVLDDTTKRALAHTDGQTAGIEQYGDYDLSFHTAFIGIGGNLKMLEQYSDLMKFRALTIVPSKEKYNLSMHQHREIVEALLRRDWDEVKAAINRHLAYSKQNLIDWIDSNGGEI